MPRDLPVPTLWLGITGVCYHAYFFFLFSLSWVLVFKLRSLSMQSKGFTGSAISQSLISYFIILQTSSPLEGPCSLLADLWEAWIYQVSRATEAVRRWSYVCVHLHWWTSSNFVFYKACYCCLISVCVHACMHMPPWRSEDNFWEWFFFFFSVGPRIQIQVVRLGNKHLYLLRDLAGPQLYLLVKESQSVNVDWNTFFVIFLSICVYKALF